MLTIGDPHSLLGYGLYLHIPFCRRKCDYCHFFVVPNKDGFHKLLIEGLEREWKLRVPLLKDKTLRSVYFGGGTPALLTSNHLGQILNWIRPPSDCEISIEANPEDVSLPMLRGLRSLGFNRLSLGIQALQDVLLQKLGRSHSAAKALQALDMAFESGFENVSVDAMYDLPGQTLEQWLETLNGLMRFPITHLSLYNLTIEPKTVFHKYRSTVVPAMPSESLSEIMYRSAQEMASKASLEQYEISAFARQGCYARHNTGYWLGRPFLGLGPSAYSFWEGQRFQNVDHLHRYHRALIEGNLPVIDTEGLSRQARTRELLAVGLRLLEGIDLTRLTAIEETTQRKLDELQGYGLLIRNQNHVRLSPQGVLVYDAIAQELI